MDERLTIEAGADALRRLADELGATHGSSFATYFLAEHWAAIERALQQIGIESESV